MINNNDLKFELIKTESNQRIIRITHLNTNIFVEDTINESESIIDKRNSLLKQLENEIVKNNDAK